MNAGNSPVGQRWAARYSDMFFTSAPPGDFETMATRADAMRALAREYRREVQVWIQGSVICRPTLREAEQYADYVGVECGDIEAVANRTRQPGLVAEVAALTSEAARLRKRELVITSYNMQPLIGTPEMIVDRVLRISRAGIDGLNLTFVNYEEGVRQWVTEILPLMEQAGLRQPFAPTNGRAAAGSDDTLAPPRRI
jgi:alkanesulfonate monooxygenase SsuD/methylene tetrahydromethanopterin reductase-like flavin-dependent oxidoreductase (luciferase family)